nr:MAG TPA: hypothetical protein [Caudoviricetes sp.]DAZ57318.1 MAG TPA: hypothetical protein [Caudoviricetes sp.]
MLHFIKFNTKINQKPITFIRRCVPLRHQSFKSTKI